MLQALKNHPFAVSAHFDYSLVLTYAVPKAQLADLIPPCLSLDTYDDQWGFVALAMVQTKGLRPKGFPEILGNDFFLIGYRVFVQYNTLAGKRLRGLYILHSETNRKKMEVLGNIFTHYNYTTTDIKTEQTAEHLQVTSQKSGLQVEVSMPIDTNIPLPATSPFPDWKSARRFAGPLPFTFTFDASSNAVLIIEGVRENWTPAPVQVIHAHSDFIDSLHLEGACLANAFVIHDIPYQWKKGNIEIWNG